jgi:hypothetical protein
MAASVCTADVRSARLPLSAGTWTVRPREVTVPDEIGLGIALGEVAAGVIPSGNMISTEPPLAAIEITWLLVRGPLPGRPGI